MLFLTSSFCSFRAQNRGSTVPRALLWAIRLLGFQPVFAACKPFIGWFYKLALTDCETIFVVNLLVSEGV